MGIGNLSPSTGFATPQRYRDRAELEAVLSSETFRRAPRLHQLLSYICEETFAGRHNGLKEYSIAVEALGRGPDFDHTTDSIVRVEAHRLRKRLAKYYETEGADRPFRITLPPGGYVPVFEPAPRLIRDAELVPVGDHVEAPAQRVEVSEVVRQQTSVSGRSLWGWALGLALVASFAAGDSLFRLWPNAAGMEGVEAGREIRISAGRPVWGAIDTFGRRWSGEQFVNGGQAVEYDAPAIERSWHPAMHATQRHGDFRYDLPLDPGFYEIWLYFAAMEDAVDNRFDVFINGEPWLQDFNVVEQAGAPATQAIRVLAGAEPAQDGRLHLDFKPRQGRAILSAFEVIPTPTAQPLPMRLLAGRASYLHDDGANPWSADHYYDGGTVVQRRHRVIGGERPDIYAAERYGDFNYLIPVAPGAYDIRFHFAETWFGPMNPGGGGKGSRLFDVRINGRPAIVGLDVFQQAGGENRAVIKTIRDLQPNARNQFEIEFISRENFAMVNAIEILPKAPVDLP